MAYDATSGLWTPDNPNGSQTGSGAGAAAAPTTTGGGLTNPNPTPGSTNTSSVSDNVNALTAGNSTYMQQAKSAGMDTANARGVQNSSIAAGTSQKAAYDAAVPIATADAANTTAKDLSAQGYAQSSKLQGQQNQANQTIAQMNIDASTKQQAASIMAQLQISGDQLAAQKAIAELNIADADKQQLLSIASQTNLADISQQTQLSVANMNVASNQQDKAMAAATSYASIYQNMVNSVNTNTQIPADARQAYLTNAKTLYDNGMSLVEQTYNVQLDWGQQSTDAGYSGGYAAPTLAPQNAQQVATMNQQVAGNYQ
jgi:hypothetical protein